MKKKLNLKNTVVCPSKLGNEFDVLCEINGQKLRLSFDKRKSGKVIALFPFKNEPEYIELAEYPDKKHTDKDVDEKRLPDCDFCMRIAHIKDRMNLYLKELHSPVLDGEYLADSSYMRGCGWIVGFSKKHKFISSDYYGGNQPAKLRYTGKFTGKCQN